MCHHRPDKNAGTRHLEADLGAGEIARHIRLAEKIAGRVAVIAATELHKIFAARSAPQRSLAPAPPRPNRTGPGSLT